MDSENIHRQQAISLAESVTAMDAQIATMLVRYHPNSRMSRVGGGITLARLEVLDAKCAVILGGVRCSICMPCIRSLDPKVAEILMSSRANELILDGIESVSLPLANGFLQGASRYANSREGSPRLFLRGLKNISPQVAKRLRKIGAITNDAVGSQVADAGELFGDRVFKVIGYAMASLLGLWAFLEGCRHGPPL